MKATGAVCQHLVHGELLTYNRSEPRYDGLPDVACTACYGLYAEASDVPKVWAAMAIHLLCSQCYEQTLGNHVLPTPAEQDSGFALVTRKQYYAVRRQPEAMVEHLEKGSFLMLGFSPVPSIHPKSIEKMWVKLDHISDEGLLSGVLDNDPTYFRHDVLSAGSTISLSARKWSEASP